MANAYETFKILSENEEFVRELENLMGEDKKVNESIWGEMERQSRDRQKRIDDLKVGKKVYKVSTRNKSYTIKADNVDDAYRKVNTLSQVKGFYNDYKNGDYWVVEVEKENFDESLKINEAFPWEEDGFFTREDLDEFTSELEDLVPQEVKVKKAYLEPGNMLEVDFEYKGYDETFKVKVDMRKIKLISDLQRKFLPLAKDYIGERVTEIDKEFVGESLLREYLSDREKKIILNGIEAIDWSYQMVSPENKKITCGLLVLPKAQKWQDGSVTDYAFSVEDENGQGVSFDDKEEAQQWLEDHIDKLDIVETRDGYKLVVKEDEELVTEETGSGITWKEIWNEVKGKYHSKRDQLEAITRLIWTKGYKNINFVDIEDAMAVAMEIQEDMFGWYDPTIEEWDDIKFSLSNLKRKR